jgi:hypothetical protein
VYTVTALKSPPPPQSDAMGRIRQQLRKANDMDNDEFELCALRLFADHRNAATPEGTCMHAHTVIDILYTDIVL